MSAIPFRTYVPILSSSQIELCKYIGLVAMIADHANKAFFDGAMAGWSEFGRLAFPLFAFALASGIAQCDPRNVDRVLVKLAFWGAVSQVFFVLLWARYDLNVLFTMLAGLLLYQHLNARRWWLLPLVCVSASVVEFQWLGVLLVVATLHAMLRPSLEATLGWAAALFLLLIPNRNDWALLALPIVYALQFVHLRLPRVRNLFYWIYPAHMAVMFVMVFALPPSWQT